MLSYTAVPINIGAKCPNGPNITPSTGRALAQLFTAVVSNCIDQDGQDYPLYTTFGYFNGRSSIQLSKKSTTALTYSAFYPSLKIYVYVIIVDSLQDGGTYNSAFFTPSLRLRSLADTSDVASHYKEDIQKYEIIQVIVNYLNSYTLSTELLDAMWQDFIGFVKDEEMTLDLMKFISSTMYQFMNELQENSLDKERVSKYAVYVYENLELINNTDQYLNDQIFSIADRIFQIDDNELFVKLCQSLINQILKFYDVLGANPFFQNTARISAYKSDNSIELINASPIALGTSFIEMDSLGLENNTIISLQAIKYKGECSDIVSISVSIKKKYENYHVLDINPILVDISKGTFTITMPKSTCENLVCNKLTENGWAASSCSIVLSTYKNITFQIQESGTYSLISKPTKTNEALYVIISLTIAAIISFIILYYLESKKETESYTISYDNTIYDIKTLRGSNNSFQKKETSMIIEKNNSNDHKDLKEKSKINQKSHIVLIFIVALTFEAYLVSLLGNYLSNLNFYPVFVGFVANGLTLPAKFLTFALWSRSGKTKNAFGYFVVLAMFVTSIVGIFFTDYYKSWITAFGSAVGGELIVSLLIIMISKKIRIKS